MSPLRRVAALQDKLAILADDLTGACDTGAMFAQRSFATVVVMNPRARLPSDAHIVVLSTNSRNDSLQRAKAKVRQACLRLHTANFRVLYKKIDSTLKGNIAAEIVAILQTAGFARAVVCPAFPEQGRVVRRGVLYVRGQCFGELSPCLEALGRFGIAPLPRPISTAKFAQAMRGTARCVIADAETDGDLRCLVKAAGLSSTPVLLVGSAGLARHLADALLKASRNEVMGKEARTAMAATKPAFRSVPRRQGWPRSRGERSVRSHRVLIFAGSRNAVTESQIDRLVQRQRAIIHSIAHLGPLTPLAYVARDRPVVFRVPMHQMPIEKLQRRLASLVPLFARPHFGSLVLLGGDTALLICHWLRVKAIALRGEIAPGIPWGHFMGGKADGVLVCTKAGGFGDANTLIRVVDFLSKPPSASPTP